MKIPSNGILVQGVTYDEIDKNWTHINFAAYGAGGNGGQFKIDESGNPLTIPAGGGSGALIWIALSTQTVKSIQCNSVATSPGLISEVYVKFVDGDHSSNISGDVVNNYDLLCKAYSGGNASGGNSTAVPNQTSGGGGTYLITGHSYSSYIVSSVYANGAAGGNPGMNGSLGQGNYTSSGSGIIMVSSYESSAGSPPTSTGSWNNGTFLAPSQGGGSNVTTGTGVPVSGYGAGGGGIPENYQGNPDAYYKGSAGVVYAYYSS